jgi:RNA polymerase sigma-70 factor, ECF subfamily
MPISTPSQFSILLEQIREGSPEARELLIKLVYQDLRRMAQSYINREQSTPSLQATALVHEVYLRLFGDRSVKVENREHFMIIASRQMRRILIDRARSLKAIKHNGNQRPGPLEDAMELQTAQQNPELIDLNDALEKFEKIYHRMARIVELRFFTGLTEAETARALGVSETTVKREWKFARAWLYGQLRGEPATEPTHH